MTSAITKEATSTSWQFNGTGLSIDGTAGPVFSKQLLTPQQADDFYLAIISNIDKKQGTTVYDTKGGPSKVDNDTRDAHWYDNRLFDPTSFATIEKLIDDNVKLACNELWQKNATQVLDPQVIGYGERCKFNLHCDNSIYKDGEWIRNDPDRDVTGILYLSGTADIKTFNNFEGGQLVFDTIKRAGKPLTILPKKGELLLFPSNHVYLHRVTPITRGYRAIIVNFWKLS